MKITKELKQDEIFNFLAQSNLAASLKTLVYSANSYALGILRFIEAIIDCWKQEYPTAKNKKEKNFK